MALSSLAPVTLGEGVRTDGPAEGLLVRAHTLHHEGTGVTEAWVEVTNGGDRDVVVDRLDSVTLDLPEPSAGGYELSYYTSGWGQEFGPVDEPLRTPRVLESLAGRSSATTHPWCALHGPDGVVVVSVAWSGNWILRFTEGADGGVRITGGLHDTGFAKTLAPGQSVRGPRVVVATGADLNDASVQLAEVGRVQWYPRNEFAESLPLEWNHWWSYEDHSIDEDVFRANADVAAELGFDICTLDAGWFGPSDPGTHWVDYRGDWHLVNARRFPSGLRALADHVHGKGMRFGLWCEIEALGPKAALGKERPELVALREREPLGYVCLGSPTAQDWAYDTLTRLVEEHGADWIKLDFNLDPGLGCDRTDHGHGAGDGLFEHYTGYYAVLERVRAEHPEVVLENCSSGGLRIDLGLARQTHLTFLSDPDWPEHGLQLLWGGSTMLHPSRMLHWGWSQWWKSDHPHQNFEPAEPGLTADQLDYYRRIAMVGAYGLSWKLPEAPEPVRARLRALHGEYRRTIAPFVAEGELRRLTGQPQRFGGGQRWAGFQYTLPVPADGPADVTGDLTGEVAASAPGEDSGDHLLLLFRLSGGEPTRTIRPLALDPEAEYAVEWTAPAGARPTATSGGADTTGLAGGADTTGLAGGADRRTGADLLASGWTVSLPEEGSAVVVLRRVRGQGSGGR
ncbi:alpha-galactosidase [Actinopolymorpha singaporensis]